MDSDDFIHPQTLEAVHYYAKKNNTKITAFLYEKEENPGDFKDKEFETYDIKNLPNLVRSDLMAYTAQGAKPRISRVVTTMLFHKDIFKDLRFKPGMYYEDTQLLLTVLKDNVMSTVLPIPFYKYRMNAASTTNQKFTEKHLNSYRTLLTDLRDQYQHDPYCRKWKFLIKTLVEPVCSKSLNHVYNMPPKEQRRMIFPLYQMITEMKRSNSLSEKKDGVFIELLSGLVGKIKEDMVEQIRRRHLRRNGARTIKIRGSQVKKLRFQGRGIVRY